MDLLITVIVVGLCVLAEGFFSGSEMAVVSSNKYKLNQQAKAGRWGARLLARWMERPEQVLSVTLTGANLSEISATVLATMYLVQTYGESGELYAFLVMAPIILLFGEIFPKTIYQHFADRLAPLVVFPLRAFSYLIYPVGRGLGRLSESVVQTVGTAPKNPFVLREELQTMARKSVLEGRGKSTASRLIHNIFSFTDTTVDEVMVPLVDLVAVNKNDTREEAIRRVEQYGYSRLPVYVDRIYNIVGIVHALDLLTAAPSAPLEDLTRPATYVPETKRVSVLLREMQQGRHPMVVVVNEYGAAIGIVTTEDLVEEIVGEIHDEYDPARTMFERCEDGSLLCDARIELDELRDQFGINFPPGLYETLAGLLMEQLGRIPQQGERHLLGAHELRIEDATERCVTRVRITRLTPANSQRPAVSPAS
ncbi:MAG: HlyC/CorC family transporter [Candidatus Tectomicrobia bacterium]|nr:HlyC/CorC family transporter [Candidatus Tectomicrobia bacterium]